MITELIFCAFFLRIFRYFLPEDGDSEDTPNVFLAPKPTRAGYPPSLGQVKKSFPLPGSYHYRFKTALVPGTDRDKNAVSVWMDCVDDSEPVPVWQGSIITKVTRTGMADDEDEYDDDFSGRSIPRADSNVSTGGYSVSSTASVHSTNQQKAAPEPPAPSTHSTDSLLGAFDDPPAPAAPAAPSAPASTHSSTENLLDVDHHPPAPASGGSLLDMDGLGGGGGGYHGSGANTPTTTDHSDLLNMSAPMPSQPRPPPAQGPIPVHAQYPPQQQHPMQRHPQQQAPMQGQYPMQYPPQQGQYPQQGMGMAQMQGQQQRQQPGRPPAANNGASGNQKNAFDKFGAKSLDPLGNLSWS